MRRFYIQPSQVPAATPYLSGREARHLKTVLRLRPKDRIVLFDGTGNEYSACIMSFTADRVNLQITGTLKTSTEPRIQLTVAQALLKGRKMDTIIRQLTEIGIYRWQPFVADRSISRPRHGKMRSQTARWEKIAREAVKQCGRSRPPAVFPPVSFNDLLTGSTDDEIRLILWEKATVPLTRCLPPPPLADAQPVLLILGPEGGFTTAEIEAAQTRGAQVASLGRRILRAETATLTASVLTLHHLGELG